jgi:hypothetical protein
MKNFKTGFGIGLVLALLSISAAPAFGASPTVCTGTIATPTTIPGDLDVPAGKTCWLFGVEVQGPVTVEGTLYSSGAKFDMSITVIGGAIQLGSLGAEASVVGGNLTITNSPAHSIILCPNSGNMVNVISGNLTYAANSGMLYVCQASVSGNVTVSNNTGRTDLNNINTTKNLSCGGNEPAPVGSGNTARQKTGQCASL